MQPFDVLTARAVPLPEANIDTDQILPARFLKKKREDDFGRYLFHDLRFSKDGSLDSDFPLNLEIYHDAQIIVALENFGCGSSRENAVWTIVDAGFRSIIAPSFGDIFHSNSLKNGLLPIRLDQKLISMILEDISGVSNNILTIDLPNKFVLLPSGHEAIFEIDDFNKHLISNGIDELDYTISRMREIEAFENALKSGK